jgi:hypothetical protein
MKKIDTYLVVNGDLTSQLRQINGFKLDLGTKLLTDDKRLMPGDTNIQKHLLYFGEYIYLIGHIGTLSIYTYAECPLNTIKLYNVDSKHEYNLDPTLSFYSNLNKAISEFFNILNIKPDVQTKVDTPVETKKEKYVKPNKLLSEMTQAERIAFARSRQ